MPSEALTCSAVLDTHIVLDWLVFRNPSVAPLATAVRMGSLRWLACARMRAELERTLDYPQLAHWLPDRVQVLGSFDAFAAMLPTPPATAAALRCSDADDQVFIDLAMAQQAQWLITHDRALLRLARPALARGVRIASLAAWRQK